MRKAYERHTSSVPPAACRQAGSFCLQPISPWHRYILDGAHGTCEGMENDFLAALFPNQVGKPLLLLDFPHTSQPHNPRSVV